ncbi:MAG: trypsin-like peptidase domain-containing protein [Acidobacteriota bacterium]
MRRAPVIAALLMLTPLGGLAALDQEQVTLRVTVTAADEAGQPVPVPRHALLVSENPASAEPRRVLTGADGTVTLRLRPGSYTIESDRPVVIGGRPYQWTQMVEVAAGRELTLSLTAENADDPAITAAPATPESGDARRAANDPSELMTRWQESVVAVWSPTARASGFVIDARGLIATSGSAVGDATAVAVQVSGALAVDGRVVASQADGAAVVRVHPDAIAGRRPLPLPCPPAKVPSLDEGDEIVAMSAPHPFSRDAIWGEVRGLAPRAIDTDLSMPFGGAGGPVFDTAGVVAGLTAERPEDGGRGRSDVIVVRGVFLCEAYAAAQAALANTSAPSPAARPVDPTARLPLERLFPDPNASAPAPVALASDDFDVAFVTPPMMARARQRAGWTGGPPTRWPEAEARLGPITDFGSWSPYFADAPPVVVVRVTPRLVEGFWRRLGREAARTQGAVLPPLTRFAGNFLRLEATCGRKDVTPLHPFVLEHRPDARVLVREGLYVFDPAAFAPACGQVTLTIYSERSPDRGQTVTIASDTLERVWQDFAAFRTTAR